MKLYWQVMFVITGLASLLFSIAWFIGLEGSYAMATWAAMVACQLKADQEAMRERACDGLLGKKMVDRDGPRVRKIFGQLFSKHKRSRCKHKQC